MAAPAINPVAMALFLINSLFLLSTYSLQIDKYKNRFSAEAVFLSNLFYDTAELSLSTIGALLILSRRSQNDSGKTEAISHGSNLITSDKVGFKPVLIIINLPLWTNPPFAKGDLGGFAFDCR
jgi:hypothetical protein